MELETEKFKAVEELSKLQLKLSETRSALRTLEEETPAYVNERERLAAQKVKEVLEASRETLAEADKNLNLISQCLEGAREAHKSAVSLAEDLKEHRKTLDDYAGEAETHVERGLRTLEDARADIQRQRLLLEGQKDALTAQAKLLGQEKRRLADERGTLERAISRLKANKI